MDDAKGSRVEPGCLRFDLLEDEDESNKFYIYSLWQVSTANEDYDTGSCRCINAIMPPYDAAGFCSYILQLHL